MESWQPIAMKPEHLEEAKRMASAATKALSGSGIWGVEFFISNADGVYFSELSPRPHDTGMVTLAGSQNFSEFELHARAVLGLPIPEITLERMAASAVILATKESPIIKDYAGLEKAAAIAQSDIRIFGKPSTRVHRRMGVAVAYDNPQTGNIDQLRKKAKEIADMITIVTE